MTFPWCFVTNTKVGEWMRLVAYQTVLNAGFGDVGVANSATHGPRESNVEMWGNATAMYIHRISPPLRFASHPILCSTSIAGCQAKSP